MVWVILILLLVCSGTISASETSLFGLSRHALHRFSKSPSAFGRRVAWLMHHPQRVLLTILVTNTTVNVVIFAVSYVALEQLRKISPLAGGVAGVGVLFAVIVFGEMLPKAIALSRSVTIAPFSATLVYTLQVVLSPIRWVLSTFLVEPTTRLLEPAQSAPQPVAVEELRQLIDHSARQGSINATENEMLQGVVALSKISVREVMVPRVDLQFVPFHGDPSEAARRLRASKRRGMLVRGRHLDDIRGYLFARDVYLNPRTPIRVLMKLIACIPEQSTLLQALRFFRSKKIQSAVVVDEYGGTAGYVTMADIAKQIVGELPTDESAHQPVVVQLQANTFRLSGHFPVREWASRFRIVTTDGTVDTVAGLILAKLGRVPKVGDAVLMENVKLTVESMRRHRIEYVLLTVDENPSNTPESSA